MADFNEILDTIKNQSPFKGLRVVDENDLIHPDDLEEIVKDRRVKIGSKVLDDSIINSFSRTLQEHGICRDLADDISIRLVLELRKV